MCRRFLAGSRVFRQSGNRPGEVGVKHVCRHQTRVDSTNFERFYTPRTLIPPTSVVDIPYPGRLFSEWTISTYSLVQYDKTSFLLSRRVRCLMTTCSEDGKRIKLDGDQRLSLSCCCTSGVLWISISMLAACQKRILKFLRSEIRNLLSSNVFPQ